MSLDTAAVDADALRTKARAARRAFAQSPLSRFVRHMREALTEYLKAREQGVSREDAVRGLEAVLREVWPGKTSKFDQCAGCDNTGWHLLECIEGMRCQRLHCREKGAGWWHTYVVPCDCVLGEKFRPQVKAIEDELAHVGKSKRKPRGFSRIGR